MSEKGEKKLPRAGGNGVGFISAETMELIRAVLSLPRLEMDPSQFETVERSGRIFARYRMPDASSTGGGAGGGVAQPNAFFKTFMDDGDEMLQGGSVTGTEGAVNVDDYKVMDGGDPEEDEDTLLWLKVTTAGITDEDATVLLPGVKVTAAELETGGELPTTGSFPGISSSGSIYFEIGRWTETGFLPAAGGNFMIGGCNQYAVNRV